MQIMKFITFFISIALTHTASANLETTTLKFVDSASIEQMDIARELLDEAIDAKKNEELIKYKDRLKRARALLASKTTHEIEFSSSFLANLDGELFNFFEDEDLRYEVLFEESCYKGTKEEALKLLKVVIEQDLLNFDEQWYENPRESSEGIIVDFTDGPNDFQTSFHLFECL
ncbi:hypothetical protein HBN50_12130 [Halobacteriovorax sp. GB3]|uniref:hypothetical protein n=1 Tax=Halobacteriovorax sp. GB3 TaxID=2719615 RepID=UPI002362651B|nr:hypothetical protein [Halobacteriovorax sp. GB3]MDD0853850.1 hypothetical protein [Halobacteriovorax sp. GB3]